MATAELGTMQRALAVVFLMAEGTVGAQPFLDVLSTSSYVSMGRFTKHELATNLPVRLGASGDRLLLSPGVERWAAEVARADLQRTDDLLGFAAPVAWLHSLVADRWSMGLVGVTRYMRSEHPDRGDWQLGGAVVVNRIMRPDLTWKFGTYANADAFGLFMMPLLGIDWRIDAKHNLFGVLPGNFTYEHKPVRWLHWGVAFKAITTSFGTRDGDFRRVDENSIGIYLDLYPVRSAVLRLEAGHTAFSQYQGGRLDPWYPVGSDEKYVDHDMGDGLYVKAMLAFRVRLDAEKSTPGSAAGR